MFISSIYLSKIPGRLTLHSPTELFHTSYCFPNINTQNQPVLRSEWVFAFPYSTHSAVQMSLPFPFALPCSTSWAWRSHSGLHSLCGAVNSVVHCRRHASSKTLAWSSGRGVPASQKAFRDVMLGHSNSITGSMLMWWQMNCSNTLWHMLGSSRPWGVGRWVDGVWAEQEML
jgi:hypothetical protein